MLRPYKPRDPTRPHPSTTTLDSISTPPEPLKTLPNPPNSTRSYSTPPVPSHSPSLPISAPPRPRLRPRLPPRLRPRPQLRLRLRLRPRPRPRLRLQPRLRPLRTPPSLARPGSVTDGVSCRRLHATCSMHTKHIGSVHGAQPMASRHRVSTAARRVGEGLASEHPRASERTEERASTGDDEGPWGASTAWARARARARRVDTTKQRKADPNTITRHHPITITQSPSPNHHHPITSPIIT